LILLVKDTDPSVDRRIMELNFFAPVILNKALLPAMLERKSGHIVVISRLVGKFGTPLRSAYAASKHALHGFFDSMRAEVGRNGIKVTIVCPAYIRIQVSVHALVGSGAEHGKTDSTIANGMDPGSCAAQILRELARGHNEIYVAAGREKYAVYLKRFTPRLFERMVARFG
jgi:short-subunit dehydrogenase